jgi:hypothetical protein
MAEHDYEDRTNAPNGGVRQTAGVAAETAGSAARDAASTVKEQAGQVAGEAKVQARNLARDVKDRVGAEARSQNDRLADGVRRFADELDQMAGERGDSPASKVVTQVSQGGRRVADYLAEHGPEGVLEGVQDFARRRPGTFLLAAAAAGFVVGRLGKGVFSAGSDDDAGYNTGTYGGGTATTRTDLLNADTQRLTTMPVQPVPVEPVPVTPQTVGTSSAYSGSPAATTGGLATEPIPTSTTVRP